MTKKTARFINRQFALVVIAFFVLSLNAISSPVSYEENLTNPFIDYNPTALAEASQEISRYVPIINQAKPEEIRDQVLSAAVGPEASYIPKPLLPETVDHKTASLLIRGLRGLNVEHVVGQGETLGSIAKNYGVNVATILDVNNLKPEDTLKIHPGTKLTIPPENTEEGAGWLVALQDAERKKREEQQKAAQKAKLAKSINPKNAISRAQAADDDSGGTGIFQKPVGPGCYNGYHVWALDCPRSPGTAVHASAGGVVRRADPNGYNGGYGKNIVIDHGNGWVTLYAHLSSISVNEGERVEAGEVIAGTGNTGHSTGPHLHFEIQKNGQRLNPGNYVGY